MKYLNRKTQKAKQNMRRIICEARIEGWRRNGQLQYMEQHILVVEPKLRRTFSICKNVFRTKMSLGHLCIFFCMWLNADVSLGILGILRGCNLDWSLQELQKKAWNARVQKTFEQQFCFTCEVFCPIGSDMFCTLCDSLGRSFVFACKYPSKFV